MRKSLLNRRLTVFLLAIAAPALALTQDVDEEPEAGAAAVEDDALELSAVTVTGSRLLGGDPSARTTVFTAEDIAARGLSTAEDVIRAIPQNLSTLNSASSLTDLNNVLEDSLGALALGVSAANLRGLGSGNTLTLVNGRRIAGNAGSQDFFANLRSIPAAAIERVEVNLDGSSAVYGSDAIAGVINIIMRKNYSGAQVAINQEMYSNDGDQLRLDGTVGYAWGTGSVTATVSDTRSDPPSNRKAGFTTNNWSSRFGGDENYDFRSEFSGPWERGVVNYGRPPFYILPPPGISALSSPYGGANNRILSSGDGTNARMADYRPLTKDDLLDELVLRDSSISTDDRSYTVNIEQDITQSLRVRGELLWTEAGSAGTTERLSPAAFFVPASNAFYNFEGVYVCRDLDTSSFPYRYAIENCEEGVYVRYFPLNEIASGLLDEPYQSSTSRQRRYVVGLEYEVTPDIKFVADYTRAVSSGDIFQYNYTVGDDNPGIQELLASSDPNVAVNLFGDGTAQNEGIRELMGLLGGARDKSHNEQLEFYLQGRAFELPWTGGERLSFVVGGERRSEWLEDVENAGESFGYAGTLGVPEPTRDLQAFFAEALLPVVGRGNALPGIQELNLTLQVRWEEYTVEGADGCEDAPAQNTSYFRCELGKARLIKAKIDKLSPTFGFRWRPVNEVSLRARLTKNFRAPAFRDLFSPNSQSLCSRFGTYDPLDGSFVAGACNLLGANPNIQSENSTNASLGITYSPEWAPGWQIEVNYAELDFQDRIAASYELSQLLPPEVYGNMPEFFERDAEGNLLNAISRPINLARRYREEVDITITGDLQLFSGNLQSGLSWHYVLSQYDQAVEEAPKVDFVGYSVGLDRYKLRFFASWQRNRTNIDLNVFHTPSYINNNFANSRFIDIPNANVDSYTTVDLTGRYRFDNGLELRAGARNLLDADFPFVLHIGGRPFDTKRVDVKGRITFVELRYGIGDF